MDARSTTPRPSIAAAWDTSKVTSMQARSLSSSTRSSHGTRARDSMIGTFNSAAAFDQPLAWDTSQVTTMQSTFSMAKAFDQPLAWDTSKVTSMRDTFAFAHSFKDDSVMRWDVSTVSVSGLNGIFHESGIMKEPCTRKFIYNAWWTDLTAKMSSQAAEDRLNVNGFSQMMATECSPPRRRRRRRRPHRRHRRRRRRRRRRHQRLPRRAAAVGRRPRRRRRRRRRRRTTASSPSASTATTATVGSSPAKSARTIAAAWRSSPRRTTRTRS